MKNIKIWTKELTKEFNKEVTKIIKERWNEKDRSAEEKLYKQQLNLYKIKIQEYNKKRKIIDSTPKERKLKK